MSERTTGEAYDIILSALRKYQLSWVAEQIQDQVRAGKPTTRVVAYKLVSMPIQYNEKALARPPRSEKLAATEPYSLTEQLTLALDAIERAIIQTADLEDEIFKFSHLELNVSAPTIFEPEKLEDVERRTFGMVPAVRRQAVVSLRQAVETLRRESEHGHH